MYAYLSIVSIVSNWSCCRVICDTHLAVRIVRLNVCVIGLGGSKMHVKCMSCQSYTRFSVQSES